jgi:hypothetical protein
MTKVSLNYTRAETESFVDHLPFRERSTWNHHRYLTYAECL